MRTIETVRTEWNNAKVKADDSAALWDAMSKSFNSDKPIPNENNNNFMALLLLEGILEDCNTALDIGCATGKYSLAIASYLKGPIMGIDISGKMIDKANAYKEEYHCDNVTFSQAEWNTYEPGHYDLTIARNTPAINSAAAFEKMLRVTDKWCVFTTTTRRTDSITDAVWSLFPAGRRPQTRDNTFLYAFDLCWYKGLTPKVSYDYNTWEFTKDFDEVMEIQIRKMALKRTVTDDDRNKIYDYLKSVTHNGQITERIETTVAMIYVRTDKKL